MKKIIISRKGTEKPIEIFVALFVVLAVALVMLRMFKGQVSDQTANLNEIAAEEEIENQMQSASNQCNDMCSDVVKKGCSLQEKVRYCTEKVGGVSRQGLDLNKDGTIMGYDNGDYYVGAMGVCEDHVYCPMVKEKCICQEEITLRTCLESILPEYWFGSSYTPCNKTATGNNTGLFNSTFIVKLDNFMPLGCIRSTTSTVDDWQTVMAGRICPI